MVIAYMQGKRAFPFFIVFATYGLSFLDGRARLRHGVVILGLFLLFMTAYLSFGKGLDEKSVLGDLFRDYTLRGLVAGSEWTQNEAMPRGAGAMFQVVFPVPRTMWESKPWPTPVYVTPWLIGSYGRVGWGFGLGFLEDGLANFGYLGALAYTFVVILACRWCDRMIYRKRGTLYVALWIPLVYGCAFSFSVLISVILFMILPVYVLGLVLCNPRRWRIVGDPSPYMTEAENNWQPGSTVQ
jgi:hypothetical protein